MKEQSVQEIARMHPIQAAPTSSCAQVAQALAQSGQGFIPISVNSRPQGVVTPWDLASSIAQGLDPYNNPARAIMQSRVATIAPSASLEQAARAMEETQSRTLCVCDEDGVLVGTLTLNQLSQAAPELAGRVLKATAYEVIPAQAQSAAPFGRGAGRLAA
ncbi:MAG: CBS domain-containing protein [Chloroflexi bacterium]|nr:CBS domain-containing protein [Chloroflexota bacterium]